MGDSGAQLGLDIVANDGYAALFETVAPVLFAGKENGYAVNHAAAGVKYLLNVPLGGLFTAHREVIDDYVDLFLLENSGDVRGGVRRLFDDIFQIPAHAVVCHTPFDDHPGLGDFSELDGVVGGREYRFGQVFTDLILIDIKGGHYLNVIYPVSADGVVHDARYFDIVREFDVFVDPLDER